MIVDIAASGSSRRGEVICENNSSRCGDIILHRFIISNLPSTTADYQLRGRINGNPPITSTSTGNFFELGNFRSRSVIYTYSKVPAFNSINIYVRSWRSNNTCIIEIECIVWSTMNAGSFVLSWVASITVLPIVFRVPNAISADILPCITLVLTSYRVCHCKNRPRMARRKNSHEQCEEHTGQRMQCVTCFHSTRILSSLCLIFTQSVYCRRSASRQPEEPLDRS